MHRKEDEEKEEARRQGGKQAEGGTIRWEANEASPTRKLVQRPSGGE